MFRHMKLLHNTPLPPIRLEGVARDSYIPQGFPSPRLDNGSILYKTGMDKSGDPMTDLLDWAIKHYTYVNSLGSIHTKSKVPASALFFPKQRQNTSANHWTLPIADIQGISGYFCESCNIFSLRPILDLGYDMTEKYKHNDLHHHVGKDVSLDNASVNSLTNALNFFMPGTKYARSLDLTDFIIYLMIKLEYPALVLNLIGIPDRWYLYPSQKDLQWLQRIVTQVGNKVELEGGEVTEFLRRAQASYAIFHIRTETSSRMFAIWITP